MKKLLTLTAMILTLCLLLCGCGAPSKPQVTVDPKFGETMDFEHEGFKITLTDKFLQEGDSTNRYYTVFSSSSFECMVYVIKEDFSKTEGLEDMSLEEFASYYPDATNYRNYELHINDDHCCFVRHEEDLASFYNFCYKGSDAFFVVRFLCPPDRVAEMEEPFFAWASGVEVE
ncbi:MAG: hypothetical protein E7554_00685 [Ruminococcaceae bacterium]|nr:hypothetical protein [Oscillospiraceae bacterium]